MRDCVTRRDFLNGVALCLAAGMTPARWLLAAQRGPVYPPALTGMRGSTDASYAAAHALRDGRQFPLQGLTVHDEVDLLVVGAGISGLAGAWYFRKQHPQARILILDNHDDFGGHARRCELQVDGRLLLTYGGSESIQSPGGLWSENALALLNDLGVDLQRFNSAFDRTLYPALGMSRGVLFTREAFGVDKLVTGDPTLTVSDDIPPDRLNARPPRDFIDDFPLDADSRNRLIALYTRPRNFWPGASVEQKMGTLASISYREFLIRHWKLSTRAADAFQKRSHDFFAVGIDLLPALEAAATGFPGFNGLGLPVHPRDSAAMEEPYIYHFPDGNASIARLLVRRLIPGVAPGNSMDDIITAPFDYARLDQDDAPTRLRLNSTVVMLRNSGERVDAGYVHDGALRRLHAKQVVYAGYNMMLPYVLPELGALQKSALARGVKAPLVYAKIAVRNWRAWVEAGVHEVTNPMGFWSRIKLDYPVSLGGHRFARTPDEPSVVHLVHVPTPNDARSQVAAWRAGRNRLFETPFEEFEKRAVDELTRILGKHRFNAVRDISAISVYRWAHGYAYGFNSLFDKDEDLELKAVARRPCGRITIANSDAAWSAYAHAAIDEAARAVGELHTSAVDR